MPSHKGPTPGKAQKDKWNWKELLAGVSDKVSDSEMDQLRTLLGNFQDIFSKDETDLGDCTVATHQINTGDSRPIKQALRRQPVRIQEETDQQVDQWEHGKVVEPSSSPWASNVVAVRK